MRWFALLLSASTGCDVVFGLDESPAPCGTASFAQAKPVDVMAAEAASVSWQRDRAVITRNEMPFVVDLPSGEPVLIDIGPYATYSLSLAPEGTSLLFSAELEPPQLFAAVRGESNTAWRIDPNVPIGTFAGVPSADAFGPRRVVARMGPNGPLQEYEDDSGTWKPIGDRHDYDGQFAPNLTPNGLSMVYRGMQADMTPAIFVANRANTNAWFGMPTVILAGEHSDPQLLDQCHALYVVDATDDVNSPMLRHYDR